MFLVTKEFTFDAAHYLPKYHGKCENLHGHTYKLQVSVRGDTLQDGLAFDFVKLKEIVQKEIVDVCDHKLLNDFIENPSAENMCVYIWEKLSEKSLLGERLFELKLWETPTSLVTYSAPKTQNF
ncbi:6-carboxytetrahydropterin synthase QueD [Candidatus Peregrinibacteria bacterium]|nr:6-carboxytetrahydropterin synthase QueD [Candidatus Peregrinibacteria bacterium]